MAKKTTAKKKAAKKSTVKKPAKRAAVQSGGGAPSSIYQIKISLNHFKPTIWRRIEAPDGDLTYLHYLIQAAMGWYNGHLHQFDIRGEYYAPDPTGEMDTLDPASLSISDLWNDEETKFTYLYDFGDSWEHKIEIEGVTEPQTGIQYPRCTAGKMACPLEDSGGAWGYGDLLQAMQDPQHENYDWVMERLDDEPIDPTAFSIDEANARLAEGPDAYPALMW